MTDIAIGTLELKWPDLVRDVAFNIASQFINGGAPESEHMDEFLIRQALREALVRHLSTSIVTMKEARYERAGPVCVDRISKAISGALRG